MSDLYDLHRSVDPVEAFRPSPYGYMVEPDGTIVVLRALQKHARVAYERDPDAVVPYHAIPEDDRLYVCCDAMTRAIQDRGHVRIGRWQGRWNLAWSAHVPVSRAQFESIDFLAGMEGIDGRDEICTDVGDGQWRRIRRRMTKPNWGLAPHRKEHALQ